MDIDGNVYKTIKNGNQWWMAENLKVTHYRNGDVIPHVTEDYEWFNLKTGAYCNYNNDTSYVARYGKKIDFKKLNHEYFNLVVNDKDIMAYSAIVYSKSLERNILLVVELFQLKGKTIYRLLFSTDTTQAPIL